MEAPTLGFPGGAQLTGAQRTVSGVPCATHLPKSALPLLRQLKEGVTQYVVLQL